MPGQAVGWNDDRLEAEAFAFLAARAVRSLPLSLPGTTGVAMPVSGGRVYHATTGAQLLCAELSC